MGQQHTELHFCHRTHRELNNVDPLTKEPLMNKDFSVSNDKSYTQKFFIIVAV
jgi:hypothetical protein